jgi:hypothetical protein
VEVLRQTAQEQQCGADDDPELQAALQASIATVRAGGGDAAEDEKRVEGGLYIGSGVGLIEEKGMLHAQLS